MTPSTNTWQLSVRLFGIGVTILLIIAVCDGWLATSAMLLLAVSIFAVVTAPRKLGLLSWEAGIPAYYALIFIGLPLIARLTGSSSEVTDNQTAEALFVATLGLLSYTAAATAMRFVPKPSSSDDVMGLTRLRLLDSPLAMVFLIAVGSASLLWSYAFGYFGLVTTEGQTISDAAGAMTAVTFVLVIGHVMAWNQYFLTRNTPFLLVGLTSVLVLVSFGVLANSKGMMLAPFLYIALCLWGVSGRFPLKLAVLSLAFYLFVAFPFVTASRFAMYAETTGISREQLAQVMVDYLLSNEWIADAAKFSAVESLGRGLLPYFVQIVEQAGKNVEFMFGRTLTEGLEMVVPRFLYPDKPDMAIGNWTAHAFGVLDPQDYITNMSPTFIGEFYMNFGFIGVCIGMFLTGILAVVIDRHLIVDRRSWMMPIMVAYVGWQESFVGHTIIPFIKTAFVWIPILVIATYLFARSKSRARTAFALTSTP